MAAYFGDMLLERRRAMGMSIQQVANIIKIRPQIIEYFETENFAAMPPRGYAQGMISSYARYLGLNPRIVVDAYFDALNAYERGLGSSARRYQEVVADASPRSANATGRFMMVDSSPVSSRFAQRPPQAGYVSEGGSPHEPVAADQLRPLPANSRGTSRRSFASGYGNPQATGRMPMQDGRRRQSAANGRRPQLVSDARNASSQVRRAPMPAGNRYGTGNRDGVPPRSGAYGRNGNRDQVPPRRGGRGGSQSSAGFPFDARLLLAILAALVFIIVLLAFLLMRGCAPKTSASAAGSAPKAQVTGAKSDENDADADAADDTTAADTDGAAANGDSADGQQPAADGDTASQPEETKVKVAIKEEGAVAFLEVKLDGKSVLGTQEVGPFEQEFTVTQQIEITTDKPSDVIVTKNGKKVRYDMKVSGVAKVTITAPQPDPAGDAAADGTDAAQDAGNGTDSTGQQ